MNLGFVTDSGSDIDPDYADKIGVKVVPLNITFSDEDHIVHKEDRNFNLKVYYKKYDTVEDRVNILEQRLLNQPHMISFLHMKN